MKSFRKVSLLALTALTLAGSLTSCATLFGGRITAHQKHKPQPGEPTRQVRVGALIADILLFPLISIPVDFATGAIYKPKQDAASRATAATSVTAKNTAKTRKH